jgi:hypothetical protein
MFVNFRIPTSVIRGHAGCFWLSAGLVNFIQGFVFALYLRFRNSKYFIGTRLQIGS